MNGLAELAESAFGSVLDTCGEIVRYARDGDSVSIHAIASTGRRHGDLNGLVATEWDETDFIITASSLLMGGVATIPKSGDTIERANGSKYVVAPVGGKQIFDYLDAEGRLIRVRTKLAAG